MSKKLKNEMPPNPVEEATPEIVLVKKIIEDLNLIGNSSGIKAALEPVRLDLEELKFRLKESGFEFNYLKTRKKALQQFIDDFPSMLGYWDKNLLNVHSNKAYAEYFGQVPLKIRGQHIKDLLGSKIYQLNLPHIKNALAGIPQSFERSIATPSGKVRHTLANYIPHYVEEGVIGFFVVVTDISEKISLEEKTQKLESALYEQSRLSSLGQMASGIAHEINNPMAIIYSDACLLIKEIKKEKFRKDYIVERLTEIEKMALRVEQIVDGLRAVTTGAGHDSLDKYNIAEIIDQALAICKGKFERQAVTIKWTAPKTAIFAQCQNVQISEIILNILSNAYDAVKTTERGVVEIEVKRVKDKCVLTISNNGPAIAKDIRDKIFLPFYSTKGKAGTGLGLKIARDLAIANKGTLELKSGDKTAFILTLKTRK